MQTKAMDKTFSALHCDIHVNLCYTPKTNETKNETKQKKHEQTVQLMVTSKL